MSTSFMAQDIRARPLLGITSMAPDPHQAGPARLALSGELCAATAPDLEQVLDGVLDGGATTVRLNLIDLELCTADGVDVLEGARDRLESLGGTFQLVGACGVVRRVLDITGTRIDP